jgi:hypothetical protein
VPDCATKKGLPQDRYNVLDPANARPQASGTVNLAGHWLQVHTHSPCEQRQERERGVVQPYF